MSLHEPKRFNERQWALILGGSSGFGLATAKKLCADGMSVFVVHRDRKGAMPRIDAEFDEIRAHGRPFIALNIDALSPEGIRSTLDELKAALGNEGKVHTLLHSIAYGNLKPIAPPIGSGPSGPLLEDEDIARTIYAMGTSLLTWTRQLFEAGLFSPDARVLCMTSEGNEIAWKSYAAVSAAKCALESVSRAIAVEYGAYGIRSNVIQAGVTDTPALRAIPGNEKMMNSACERNPLGRLTQPEDVAGAVSLLSTPDAAWINGAILRVDGGEHVSSR